MPRIKTSKLNRRIELLRSRVQLGVTPSEMASAQLELSRLMRAKRYLQERALRRLAADDRAQQLADAVAKQTMLEIAQSCDNLAAITEARVTS